MTKAAAKAEAKKKHCYYGLDRNRQDWTVDEKLDPLGKPKKKEK